MKREVDLTDMVTHLNMCCVMLRDCHRNIVVVEFGVDRDLKIGRKDEVMCSWSERFTGWQVSEGTRNV